MFDLNILCVGQTVPTTIIPDNSNIWITYSNDDFRIMQKRYIEIDPLMNYIDGIWYELYRTSDEYAGTCICDYSDNSGVYPYWVLSESVQEDLRPMIIDSVYYDSFIAILKYLLKQSPIKTIFLSCRYQSEDKEIICGTLCLDDFINFLQNKKILTNICYSICE